ncbi:hypothetical protein SFC65_20375 [Priestia filamentosa]|uniref:hypothetical protein n=1 Tax=Priestia filamentosa TaxID=1402861 RepID=UPI003981B204
MPQTQKKSSAVEKKGTGTKNKKASTASSRNTKTTTRNKSTKVEKESSTTKAKHKTTPRKATVKKSSSKMKKPTIKKIKEIEDAVSSVDFPKILRLLFFSLIVGIIIYQYYLISEEKFQVSQLVSKDKKFVFIAFFVLGYTALVYRLGYNKGKSKKR